LVADTQAVISFGSAALPSMQRVMLDFKKMCQGGY
jgi:hypothetical protein